MNQRFDSTGDNTTGGGSRRDFLKTVIGGAVTITLPEVISRLDAGDDIDEDSLHLTADHRVFFESEFATPIPNPLDEFLAQSPSVFQRLPQLTELTLGTEASQLFGVYWDMERLAQSRNLRQFDSLHLSACSVGPRGVASLMKSKYLDHLESLTIRNDRIGDEGAIAIANSAAMRNLKVLFLWRNDIGARGLQALAASPHLRNLERFLIFENHIGDKGLEIINTGVWQDLEGLLLWQNGITDRGARYFATACRLDKIDELEFLSQDIREPGRTALERRFGDAVSFEFCDCPHSPWVAAIARVPRPDRPRLDYADWLVENVDDVPAPQSYSDPPDPRSTRARAELLRLQCRLVKQSYYDEGHFETELLQRNLLAAYADDWLDFSYGATWSCGEIPNKDDTTRSFRRRSRTFESRMFFHRGMVEEIRCAPESFLRNIEGLFQRTPTLTRATLNDRYGSTEVCRDLANSDWLAKLTHLELHDFDEEQFEILSATTRLKRLQRFALDHVGMTPSALQRLLDNSALQTLQELSLTGCSLDEPLDWHDARCFTQLTKLTLKECSFRDGCFERLFSSPRLAKLTDLTLDGIEQMDEIVEALANSPHVRNLRYLKVRNAEVNPDRLTELIQSPLAECLEGVSLWTVASEDDCLGSLFAEGDWKSLRGLMLTEVGLGPEHAKALADAPWFEQLNFLDLGENRLTDEGLAVILDTKPSPRLHTFELNGNDISDDGIKGLAASSLLEGVSSLSLSDNPFGERGAQWLAESSRLSNLGYLSLFTIDIGPKGAHHLSRARWLSNLACLQMCDNGIGDAGVKAFANAPLDRLRTMLMVLEDLTDTGATALVESSAVQNLVGLDLRGNSFSEEMEKTLEERFGSRVRLDSWSLGQTEVEF